MARSAGDAPGSRSVEGTSLAGSIVARWRANPRTTQSRWRQRCGCASTGSRAHISASSVVIRSAPACSRKLDEALQQPAVLRHLEPEPAADPQIVSERVAQRGHAAPTCAATAARARRSAVAVDLGVDRGGLLLAVAQHLADLRQATRPRRSISVAAVCRSRCAPTRGSPARSHAARTTHADRAAVQPLARRGHPQEHRPALAPRPTAKIGHDRLADIDRQRQLVIAAALAAHEQQPAAPVDVIEPDRGDLAGAQPQPRQQQQDRVVAPADQPAPIATGQQPLDRRRLQPARQRAIPQIRDRRAPPTPAAPRSSPARCR